MGGFGSSRWVTHSKKLTVEDCLTLGVYQLRRAYGVAAFTSGSQYPLSWDNGSQMNCYVGYIQGVLSLCLDYNFRNQPRTPVIKLSTTDCEYGGVRYWIHCPYCHNRCAKLYLYSGWFACRKCHDLTYTSSQEAHRYAGSWLISMFGTDFKEFDTLLGTERLLEKWEARKRLTKGERQKIADYFGVPLHMIRTRWYQLKTRARRELEHRAFVRDLLK